MDTWSCLHVCQSLAYYDESYFAQQTVLRALRKIEVDIPESMDVSDETDREFEYVNYFFDAFNGDLYKKRDVHFIYEMAANTTRMILDKKIERRNVDSARK